MSTKMTQEQASAYWHLRPVHRHRHLGARRVHEGILRRRRRRPPGVNGMATAADWMSAASFISMAGLIA
jgi:hypothetical protein